MRISFNQKLLLFSLVLLTGIGFTGYVVYQSNHKLLDSEQWVQHTEQVIYESGNILSLAKDIQAAAQGFAMTGDTEFLAPLYPAQSVIFQDIIHLRELTKDNVLQQPRIDSLDLYVHERLNFSYQIISARNNNGLLASSVLLASKEGRNYIERIRDIITDIQKEETVLLALRRQANKRSVAEFNRVSVVLFVLMIVFTILLFFAVRSYMFQNKEKEKRTAELIVANRELKQAEEQSKEYQHFFNNNNDLCGIANTNGYFESINTTFSRVLGYSAKEFCAIPFIDLIHPDDVASTLQIYDNLKTGALVINFINRYRKKDASYLYLDWNATPNPLTGKLYCVARDITERKKTEEQLIAVNKELESFSYSVSHDLRAPLRAIHGYVQILKEDCGDQLAPEADRLMNNIMGNAKKMGQLIDDLLTFSRLGRKELVKQNISMEDMVKGVCAELNSEHNYSFRINELPQAQADSVTIKQVWVNLISNAMKYSKLKDKPVIEIGALIKENEIIYYVKDNGAGFDMRYANKLFGVFQRLHSDEEFEGTGVGLAIVKRIIAKHGGSVWAEGKLNEGAKFYFTVKKT